VTAGFYLTPKDSLCFCNDIHLNVIASDRGYFRAINYHGCRQQKFSQLYWGNAMTVPTYKTYYKSPLGPIEIVGGSDSIMKVNFVEDMLAGDTELTFCVMECVKQIDEYFKGERKEFFLNLQPRGTDFQKSVWRRLEKIPYGETVSYSEISADIGRPGAYRAVGSANGKNPIALVIPCHRVVGSDGSLTGYGGGLWRKEWLLKHETGWNPDNIIA
jgi:methylated-DNA-[protein]-cysteine S-methyltransferase